MSVPEQGSCARDGEGARLGRRRSATPRRPSPSSSVRILLVDDNPHDRDLVARELQRRFDRVSIEMVRDAAGLDDALRRDQFDVAITDYQILWASGAEVLRRIKKDDPERPVIMFTASGSEEVAVAAMKEGLDDYITKTASHFERIPRAVKACLDRREARRRSAAHSHEAEESRALLQTLLDHVQEGVAVCAGPPDFPIVALSRQGRAALRQEAAAGQGGEARHPGEAFGFLLRDGKTRPAPEKTPLHRAAHQGEIITDEEWRLARPGARPAVVQVSARPVRDAQGRILGAVASWRDVTEWKKIETRRESALRAERAARSSAEESNRMKDEFLAVLSHELRTPLNAMLGWLHLLRGDALDVTQTEHALEVVHRNARVQAQLIEEVLDASRIITGKLQIAKQPVRPAGIIQSAVESIAPEARSRKVVVTGEIPPDLPVLMADPRRLPQILGNILGNAVKFTPPGGTVRVTAAAERKGVRITVHDEGIGVAKEFLPHVFDRFRQAVGGTMREHGGLGLGLAITRHLVEAHGGTIRLDSAGPGQGTTVEVVLPEGGKEAAAGVVEKNDDGSLPILKDMTALVVDDHEDSSEILAALLERRGAQVLRAADAGSAIDTLASARPDLLIADIAMPGMDGQELIRRLRKQGNAIPAIALSAYARPEDRDRALRAGFDAYCTKPVDAHEILRVIASLNHGPR